MASWLPELLAAGVRMIGGCCGTTPAHIAAFKTVVDEWNKTHA
jgi:methionine synthase I (cobalamin-dependent)